MGNIGHVVSAREFYVTRVQHNHFYRNNKYEQVQVIRIFLRRFATWKQEIHFRTNSIVRMKIIANRYII